MEESQQLEKLPQVVTGILKIVLSSALIALALVLIIALVKITFLGNDGLKSLNHCAL